MKCTIKIKKSGKLTLKNFVIIGKILLTIGIPTLCCESNNTTGEALRLLISLLE